MRFSVLFCHVPFLKSFSSNASILHLISSLKLLPFKEIHAIAKTMNPLQNHLFVSRRSNNILTYLTVTAGISNLGTGESIITAPRAICWGGECP